MLASGSASRKALLTAAGVAFIADPADLDEAALMADLKAGGAEPKHGAATLARAKGAGGVAPPSRRSWCWAATA